MSASPSAPSPTPRPAKSGNGCLIAVLALPVVIVIGLLVGKALSDGGDEPRDERVTLDEGSIAGSRWRVDAVLDVQDDVCAFLYEDGSQLTGSCDDTPQDATFGDQTVVFGFAGDRDHVEVDLSDGSTVEADTVAAGGIPGRFYVAVVDADVDAEGFTAP